MGPWATFYHYYLLPHIMYYWLVNIIVVTTYKWFNNFNVANGPNIQSIGQEYINV